MSIIRADSIKNRAGNGAPDFPNGITVTGIVTSTVLDASVTNLTVTGNLGVGGTVTYEDVSNVDSVGVVTARAGINLVGNDLNVGSNIKIGNASGIITATSYRGDGSQLSGMSAGLQSMNVYTNPGTATWTKPSGITKVKVYVTGGGGGCSAVGGNRVDDIGAGGAAGGTAIKIIDVSSISSVTVTVGMGGTATPYNYNENVSGSTSPNDGQPSSFGSHCSATGGKAGRSYYTNNANLTGHAVPGVGSGGDINIQGGYGDLPTLNMSAPEMLPGGLGGVSFWGGPGRGAADDNFTNGNHDITGGASTGSSAGAFGSGGSAGSRDFTGGAGTHGVVVVENYA